MGILAMLVTVLAAGVLYQRLGVTRQRRQFPPPGAMLDVGGHRLHVTCRGTGTPVVLLESAIAASSLSWALVEPAVAASTRVCTYDRAGLGWSDLPSRPRSFERIVDDLCTLLDHVGPRESEKREKYVLVGHSFGTFVVRAFAMRRPELVAGLVLVDPALEWLTTNPERARLLWGGRKMSRLGALLAHLGVVRASLALLTGGAPGAARQFAKVFGPTAAHTLERLVGEVRKLPPELHQTVRAIWCQPKCFHAMGDHLRVLERDAAHLNAVVTPRDIPVVVISSGGQPAEQLAAHRLLAHASDRGRHVIATQSAHWIQFDEPELIIDAINDMVASHRAAIQPPARL
jgi:pimeloyl-ACP methyl ester carboxylesterase